MSLSGINNPYSRVGVASQDLLRTRIEQNRTQQPDVASTRTTATPQRPAAAAALAPSNASLPAEAPEGTDPALWSILTGEERAFFAKAGAMGPLTYGRMTTSGGSPTPPPVRGGRLDVRA
jgi:hypothetical protein